MDKHHVRETHINYISLILFADALLQIHILCKYVLLSRYEVNETIRSLTLVAYRNKGTYGNVSLFFYAQNLEAQQGLDYNASERVRYIQCH